MRIAARCRSWCRGLWRRSRLEADLSTELQFHIEAYAADLTAAGMSEAEAYRRARIEFGSVESHKEDVRASVGLWLMDDLRSDLRYTMRMLRQNPGFTAVAVISLALGIGANTAIATLANSILFERLAVPHPEQLRLLSWSQLRDKEVVGNIWGGYNSGDSGRMKSTSFSYPVFQELKKESHDLELFGFKPLDGHELTATLDGSAEVVTAELASGNYFRVLQMQPQAGRLLNETDDRRGSELVAVLSDGYWTARFGRSPTVIGKRMAINLVPVTIVGVAPREFTGVASVQTPPNLFLPLQAQPLLVPLGTKPMPDDPEMWWVLAMGRLRDRDATRRAERAAQLHFDSAVRGTMSIQRGFPLPQISLLPGDRGLHQAQDARGKQVAVLLVLVALVLLLACANIATMLLARSAVRRREIGIRLAIGAARGRLVRQLLTEGLTLSTLGGMAGLGMGYALRNALPHFLNVPWDVSSIHGRFDGLVVLYAATLCCAAGVLFGLAPAWASAHVDVNAGLREQALRMTRGRKAFLGQGLVVTQVALSLLLVIAAGLFVKTLFHLSRTNIGFDSHDVLLFEIDPPETRYAGTKGAALVHRLAQRVQEIPGVEIVGYSSEALLADSIGNAGLNIPSETGHGSLHKMSFVNSVNADFFRTMHIPMMEGRSFTENDVQLPSTAVVVNQQFAKQLLGGEAVLGRDFFDGQQRYSVVGVCKDAKYWSVREDAPVTMYPFYRQSKQNLRATFEVRTKANPSSLVTEMRKAVQSVDPDLPLMNVRSQDEQIEANTADERLFAAVAAAFGVLSLLIASIGIYGLLAYSVASRTNELGIRMALGAQSWQVIRLVLRETSLLFIAGVVIGLAGAFGLARFLESMLYGVKPADPIALSGSVVLLLAAAIMAAFLPARRAITIDPMQAIKHE